MVTVVSCSSSGGDNNNQTMTNITEMRRARVEQTTSRCGGEGSVMTGVAATAAAEDRSAGMTGAAARRRWWRLVLVTLFKFNRAREDDHGQLVRILIGSALRFDSA